jgi:hypothetical protein
MEKQDWFWVIFGLVAALWVIATVIGTGLADARQRDRAEAQDERDMDAAWHCYALTGEPSPSELRASQVNVAEARDEKEVQTILRRELRSPTPPAGT